MIWIGVTGLARSGKDTLVEMIRDEYKKVTGHSFDYVMYHKSLATPMKVMVTELLMFISEPEPLNKEEEIPVLEVTYRKLLQTLGTEWGRNLIKEDLWLDVLRADVLLDMQELDEDQAENLAVIISDIRYDNEAAQCDYLFKVERPNVEKVRKHTSEQGVDSKYITQVVLNDGTMDDLRKKAKGLAAYIFDGIKNGTHKAKHNTNV